MYINIFSLSSTASEIHRLEELLKAALLTIDRLEKRVAELEAELKQRSVKKTSSNSSIPPSIDIARKNQSLRASSGKPVGGQAGHKGHNLLLSATPDIVVDLAAQHCRDCGADLKDVCGIAVNRRQVVDIPPVKPVYTEYRQFVKQCPCCSTRQFGNFPEGVTNHIQYGANVQAMAVYNWQYQYLPFYRLQQWFRDILGLAISKGTLENIIRKAAIRATPAYQQIKQYILASTCIGTDETGMKVNGEKHWVWVWQTPLLTFLSCAESRGCATINKLFPEGFLRSVLVSDRWKAQLATPSAGHQLCLAHLLRDINFIIAAEPQCGVAPQLKSLLQKAIHQKKGYTQSAVNNKDCIAIEYELDQLLQKVTDKKIAPLTTVLQKSLLKYRHYVFPFLYIGEVPFENNASERSIRMVKVKQKVSGCFKSLQHDFCTIKSVVDTAIKNGSNAMQAIRNVIQISAG